MAIQEPRSAHASSGKVHAAVGRPFPVALARLTPPAVLRNARLHRVLLLQNVDDPGKFIIQTILYRPSEKWR